MPIPYRDLIQDPRRQKALRVRTLAERGIREFFENQGFLETRTPLLVPSPGMEPHIRPLHVNPWDQAQTLAHPSFLPTSPEFAMKRLLTGGLDKIFQICPAFRSEPVSTTHLPEFTLLEWYRAHATHQEIMRDTEELFLSLCRNIHRKQSLDFQGQEISLKTPWPRLRVRDLFLQHAKVDLVQSNTSALLHADCKRLGLSSTPDENWDDLYFKIWLNFVEPKLPANQAVFVVDYPPSQSALAVVAQHPDGTSWAQRFEVYAGGLELANAFQELTDLKEQRARFEKDMNLRTALYGEKFPKTPIDEGFLRALAEGYPPSAGIALGVDRLIMLLADEPDIQYTFWLTPEWPLK